jgi:hypothetical protein
MLVARRVIALLTGMIACFIAGHPCGVALLNGMNAITVTVCL